MNTLISMEMDKVLYYLAGLIDGEGCVHLTDDGKYANISISVSMTARDPVELLCKVFGGNITFREGRQANHRDQFRWTAAAQADVYRILLSLQGKVIVKAEQVKYGLLFIETVIGKPIDVTLNRAFYLKFRELNKRGISHA